MLVNFGTAYIDPDEIAAISPAVDVYGYDWAVFLRSGKIIGVDCEDLPKAMERIGIYKPEPKTEKY